MPIERNEVIEGGRARPRYEAIAAALEAAIGAGRVAPGSRLPTVRELAHHLGVSGATVAAAYDLLGRQGWTRGEVGRGTFVSEPAVQAAARGGEGAPGGGPPGTAWRNATQMRLISRLSEANPGAIDAASGTPDPGLLPLELLREAWAAEIAGLDVASLQYGDATPEPQLVGAALAWLRADEFAVAADEIVVGSSAIQLIDLALQALMRPGGAVAVEEPAYPTAADLVERRGHRPVAVAVDEGGAVPESLAAALGQGARVAILTPRAHNPTGASWSAERRAELAAVVAGHPHAAVIEDDHAAGIVDSVGRSMRCDAGVADRVIHLRTLSKAIAPDLRIAVGVVRPRLRGRILDHKQAADGWTSRLSQRVVARVLDDGRLPALLAAAREEYARRRLGVHRGLLAAGLVEAGGDARLPGDGLNLWVRLPGDVDGGDVAARAAAQGVIVQSCEGYHLTRGARCHLRISVGNLAAGDAYEVGETVGRVVASDPAAPGRRLPVV